MKFQSTKYPNRILLLGLDASGRTTILQFLKTGDTNFSTIPTIGFNVEEIKLGQRYFTLWDIGGGCKIKELWKHYVEDCAAIAWVCDSAAISRIQELKVSIEKLMKEAEMQKVPFLLLANKQDLPNAISGREMAEGLGFYEIKDRKWFVEEIIGREGIGVLKAFEKLEKIIKN